MARAPIALTKLPATGPATRPERPAPSIGTAAPHPRLEAHFIVDGRSVAGAADEDEARAIALAASDATDP